MKRFSLILLSMLCGLVTKAQTLDNHTKDSLLEYEIKLSGLASSMVLDLDEEVRITSGKNFIRFFGRALKLENSYFYPFDSLKNVIIQYAPDDLFRIFTWNVATDDEHFRYFGVIQMNPLKLAKLNKKVALYEKMYPLIDRSDSLEDFLLRETDANHWYGAAYYKIIKTTHKNQDYYTLLGWDGADSLINRKVAEVLTFRKGKPVFGAKVFDLKRKVVFYRMVFQFNNHATMTLRYDEKKKVLIFENIVPDKPQNVGMFQNYLPDGSFDFLIWKKGVWEKQPGMFDKFD